MRILFASFVLFGLSAALNLSLAERTLSRPYDVTHVPNGTTARAVALGHRTFLSDLYWLSTVQYLGESKADERGWGMLYPLVDLVTDLDPRHGYAYQTAGIVLSAVGRLEESNRILLKGMEKGPPRWTFPFYISFNYWFYLGDYVSGARYAEIAARTPGASPNISHLAVALAAKSGTPANAIDVLLELRQTISDEATIARLDEQLKLAILERDAQALERAAAQLEKQRGWPIASLDVLVWTGLIPEIPSDPFGGHYIWDALEGRVHSSVNPFRFSPAEEPNSPGLLYRPPPEPDQRKTP